MNRILFSRAAPAAFLSLFLWLAASATAAAVSISLSWDRNSEPNIAGYRVHYGTVSEPFTKLVDVATNSATVPDLVEGTTYLFAVSAYNSDGFESAYSSPIAYYATATPDGGQFVTLANISSRDYVQTGDNVMIGGFIVQGENPKIVALRAIGPSLAGAGVTGTLSDPVLDVRDSSGALIASNDSWSEADAVSLTAFGLAPTDSREAALILTLPSGAYSAVVHGKGTERGVALFELYNLDRTEGSIANISTRGLVETGDRVMIGGFIVGGSSPTTAIVRAIGPSLVAKGVSNALLDPSLELYDSEGTLIASNNNWRSTQPEEIINSTVPPTDDREAAIVRTLNPGSYSAIVRGENNTTGVALVEVYGLGQ